MSLIHKLIIIALFISTNVDTARILCYYPVPFHSHEIVFEALTEELSRQGHQVVVVATMEDKKLPNVTTIDVRNISYSLFEKLLIEKSKTLNTIALDSIMIADWFYSILYPVVEAQLNAPEVQTLLKNNTEAFDLIIVEGSVRLALVISAGFKAPVVLASTFHGNADNYYTVGAAIDPIIFPDCYVLQTWHSTLWDKLSAIYVSARIRLAEWNIENIENSIIKNYFGEEAPTMAELRKNVQMLLLNVHHSWDYNRPVPPNVLYIGSLNEKTPKPLHKDLKKYLDQSKNGVIYMSLGSKFKSSDLPEHTIHLILKVFAVLPYDIIWKWDAETLPEKSKNVRIEKWLPQSDMLFHPKIKAFITHAGLQSTNEAILAKVPMIGVPIWGDQPTNAANYERHGIGISINTDSFNEEEFKNAIISVAENPSYRRNIDKLARVFEVERSGALEKALRMINHIATYGGHELRPPLPDLSFVEYYMLDVIGAIGLAAVTAIGFFTFLVVKIYRCVNTFCKPKKLKLQ